MTTQMQAPSTTEIEYPSSDGQPMADNTKQFNWIVLIKENIEALFRDDPQVFVAGDLLWYPVEGDPSTRHAPDAMVVFGRPKGDRRSYMQWREGDLPPQVVFEVLSPKNNDKEMLEKFKFYERHAVDEYYVYDPDTNELNGWLRRDDRLQSIEQIASWTSPRLGIRFALTRADLAIYRPNGERFLSHSELEVLRDQERQRAEYEYQRADRLAQKLRELGIDPDSLA